MASYLLLRNNKESGPYSLEGLIQLGLKPYDLVWVEGRSAAWRYPSEVEDLKFYAPAVEEQPFDRFYKKPSELKAEEEKKQQAIEQTFAKAKKTYTEPEVKIVSEINKEISKPVEKEINKTVEEEEIKIPRKQVYVSMPANSGKTVFIKKTEQVATANGNATANSLYGNGINETYKEEPVKKTEPIIANTYAPSYSELVNDYYNNQPAGKKTVTPVNEQPDDQEYPLEKKYSQSLDDIKDMYVQTLVDRKRKNAQRKMMMNVVKRVLPFAAVLIIGILMGVFVINKDTGKKQATSPVQPVNKDAANTTNNAVQALKTENAGTANSNVTSNANDIKATGDNANITNPNTAGKENDAKNGNSVNDANKIAQQNTPAVNTLAVKKTNKKDNKTTSQSDSNTASIQPKSVETDPATGERNKVVRTADTDNTNSQYSAAKQFSNSLMKQVTVQSNEYKRGTFGGIHDLQLTVNNTSNYLLDNVLVELQFLKPNDQPLKTDNIRFSPVPPNGSLTLAIPPTSRGVKVAYKIIHVESKSAGNDTAGLK